MTAGDSATYDEFEGTRPHSIADYELARKVTSFRLEALEPFASYTAGDPFAQAVIVLGDAGAGEDLLSDAAVIALAKALEAMGYRAGSLFAIALDDGAVPASELEKRLGALRPLIELVDPTAVIATDAMASDAVRSAFGLSGNAAGHVRVLGRSIVLLDDFKGALDDDARKREAWQQLRKLR